MEVNLSLRKHWNVYSSQYLPTLVKTRVEVTPRGHRNDRMILEEDAVLQNHPRSEESKTARRLQLT